MKNFVQKGEVLHYEVQEGDVIKSGDMVAVGSVVGVATANPDRSGLVAISVQGVYNIPVPVAAGEISQGDKVYFNAAAKEITLAADNGASPPVANLLAGFAWEDGDPGGVVPVKLIG